MKTIEEFIKELNGSEALQKEFEAIWDMEALEAFLKKCQEDRIDLKKITDDQIGVIIEEITPQVLASDPDRVLETNERAAAELFILIENATQCIRALVLQFRSGSFQPFGSEVRFGDGCVSLTTRLSAEVTGIPYEKIEAFRAFLAESGMETGGTGSLVRPIVCCKGTTCRFGLLDTYALAAQLHERFYKGYHEVQLPHKFKIAVGGCPNSCVKPALNDLGIVGWRGGCRIYIGGRWGKKQAAGRPRGRVLAETEDVLRVVEKAILLFKEQGRPGERFGDVIDRLGFENVEAALLSDIDD